MTTHDADSAGPIGPAGVPFPSEREWLDLPLPSAAELALTPDFVDRTLGALAAPPTADQDAEHDLDLPLLGAKGRRAFAAPEPSTTFVDDTLLAIRRDKTSRWRDLMMRHTAPDPSPQFVARTLAALAAERSVVTDSRDRIVRLQRFRFAAWPLLAVAAAAMLWLLLRDRPEPALELRLAQQEPVAFAHAYAATPMAAVLDARDRSRDPSALTAGGPDATWLLLESLPRETGR